MKKFITMLLAAILSFSASASTKDELECFATAIYHEARGEPILGQIAVGWVILNRVLSASYPHKICDVVYQPNQFSWVSDTTQKTINLSEYIKVKSLASDIIKGMYIDPTHGALYFNNIGKSPAQRSVLTRKIENHFFYK